MSAHRFFFVNHVATLDMDRMSRKREISTHISQCEPCTPLFLELDCNQFICHFFVYIPGVCSIVNNLSKFGVKVFPNIFHNEWDIMKCQDFMKKILHDKEDTDTGWLYWDLTPLLQLRSYHGSRWHTCLPGFFTPVLTEHSFQSHRLLFSNDSEVRGKNMPERNFASNKHQTHNHQVLSQTHSPLSHIGGPQTMMTTTVTIRSPTMPLYFLWKQPS